MDSPANEKFLWFLLSEVEVTLFRVTSTFQRSTSPESNDTLNEYCTKLKAAKSNLQQALRAILSEQNSDFSFCAEEIDNTRELIQQAVSFEELVSTETPRKEAGADNSEKSLRMVGGKWTQTFANHSVDPKEKLTTAVGRLKRDYDQQVMNILLLERERNELEVRVIDLENQLQRSRSAPKPRGHNKQKGYQ